MRIDILEKLRCPRCFKGEFEIVEKNSDEREIRTGTVICINCKSEYRIDSGILNILGEIDDFIRAEQIGWERFADEEGWLKAPNEYLLQLPRPHRPIPTDTLNWDIHADNFDMIMDQLSFAGKDVLDVGAGRCWSTKYFALGGANCIAMDIVSHSGVGLGASDVIMQHEDIYFERAMGDMNNMPFEDGMFDIVFFTGALHHTTDLEKAISEVARVLRKNGQLAMTNEACGGIFSFETVRLDERQEGINEHNYRFSRYLCAMKKSGFTHIDVFPDIAFRELRRATGKHRILNPVFSILPGKRWAFRWKMYLFGGPLILLGEKE